MKHTVQRAIAVAALLVSGQLVGTARAEAADPTTCPVIGALAPGTPGVVDITPEGDTWVAGELVHDCPPYGGSEPAPPPRPTGHVTIHRFPGREPLLLVAPVTASGAPWHCVDMNTGGSVQQGDFLRSPNPGVHCVPPAGYSTRCTSVQSGGYFSTGTGAGAVIVTSACNGPHASTPLTMGQSGSSGPVFGEGTTPWLCQVQEYLAVPALTDYWVFCDVNVP